MTVENNNKSNVKHYMVEISPNYWVRLRGEHETRACIERDFYIPNLQCWCCQAEMYCIRDADYVICPKCNAISPAAESISNENKSTKNCGDGGVAKGFTTEELLRWQYEIVMSRLPSDARSRLQEKHSSNRSQRSTTIPNS